MFSISVIIVFFQSVKMILGFAKVIHFPHVRKRAYFFRVQKKKNNKKMQKHLVI